MSKISFSKPNLEIKIVIVIKIERIEAKNSGIITIIIASILYKLILIFSKLYLYSILFLFLFKIFII